MKTILLISPYWQEEHRWMVSSVKMAELWQRLGYKVVVLCMGRSASGKRVAGSEKISETLEIHRVPDHFIPDPWNYGIAFGFSGAAVTLARTLKPDVIVVNKVLFWSSISLLRLRMAGFKVLLITDALVGITWWPRGTIGKVCGAIYANTLGWLLLKAATKIVFFHPQPEKVLRRLGIAKKSMVIPTGIDQNRFSTIRSQRTHSTVTYVGRLESVKGVDDFIAAALIVRKDHPTANFQVVGWYKDRHPLVLLHDRDIRFTGRQNDVVSVLNQTDIFILPSYAEGLSNALMEAMSAGCACIASDVGGNRYLIENGVSGFLFPAGDREALASHIRRLLDDPVKREQLGLRARMRIELIFSWEKVGKQYDSLFSSWNT
ncbi:MAG: glycosyltransferase [Candidatus Peribacteraceae bacterium]|nr:glycosyltransferase [Candidatus Peribacteraceae bacterium]MBP9850315.1 glycosyltransferase [Candidatus Peribacteraceae bacterium]